MTTADTALSAAAGADSKASTALMQSAAAASAATDATTLSSQAGTDAAAARKTAEDALAQIQAATKGSVTSFNGRAGAVVPAVGDYTAAMLGLGNVENTSDLEKPVSAATQAALDTKASKDDLSAVTASVTETITPRLDALASSKADVVHTHVVSDITGLSAALAGKAAATHTHAIADVTNLQAALDGKAPTAHTHSIAEVNNLQATLDGKAAAAHTHAIADVSGLQTSLDGKAPKSHTHAISDVTNLQASLDGKLSTSGGSVSGNLSVSGTMTAGSLNTAGIELSHATPFIDFHFAGSTADYTSRIIESASGTLTCQGNWVASGNVTAYSDIRLKTDLTSIRGALEKVQLLTGYTYTRRDSGERHTGLVAQDVQRVLPEAVHLNPDGYLSVAYGNMVGLLVEAVKTLAEKVKKLEGS